MKRVAGVAVLAGIWAAFALNVCHAATEDCHGYRMQIPLERPPPRCDADSCEVDQPYINDSYIQSCNHDSGETASRAKQADFLPTTSEYFTILAHPAEYRTEAREYDSISRYVLHRQTGMWTMWPGNYAASEDWELPDSVLPWRCQSIVYREQLGDAAGDEVIVCVTMDNEAVLTARLDILKEARGERADMLAAIASFAPYDPQRDGKTAP